MATVAAWMLLSQSPYPVPQYSQQAFLEYFARDREDSNPGSSAATELVPFVKEDSKSLGYLSSRFIESLSSAQSPDVYGLPTLLLAYIAILQERTPSQRTTLDTGDARETAERKV